METTIYVVIFFVVVFVALKKFESLKGKTNEELEAMLAENANPVFYRNVLLELKRRGVEIDKYRCLFPKLMESDTKNVRIRGWGSYRDVYPESAGKYELKLVGSKEEYKQVADKIRKELSKNV